jgi:hypothetical protein
MDPVDGERMNKYYKRKITSSRLFVGADRRQAGGGVPDRLRKSRQGKEYRRVAVIRLCITQSPISSQPLSSG